MLALLPRVAYRPGSLWRLGPREEGLGAVDIDRRAVAHLSLARHRECLGVWARAGCHREGAVPSRAQLTHVTRRRQAAPWSAAAPAAHLEHRIDAARFEF